jgi:hypothetical protein
LLRRVQGLRDQRLMDVGDVLADEFKIVQDRRAILQNSVSGTANPNPLGRTDGPTRDKLVTYYQKVHGLRVPLAALCLSGGGIRSAAFALGVVQGLAARGVLQKFDYLSTVSGGGYLGSFLTAWVQRAGYAKVCDDLIGKIDPDEMSPVQYLRRYSSYLTPRKGLLTADTLTVIAYYFRNLVLNWLIMIPLVLVAVVAIKILAAGIWSIPASSAVVSGFGLIAIALTGLATMQSLRQRPGWEIERYGTLKFQLYTKWPLLLGGIAASCAAMKYFQLPAKALPEPAQSASIAEPGIITEMAALGIIVAVINFISWMIAFFIAKPASLQQMSTRENVRSAGWVRAAWTLASFTISGAVIGSSLGALFYFVSSLKDPQVLAFVLLCFGPPILISAYFVGEMVHIGITSYIRWGDGEREWLATAAGYHGRIALRWVLAAFIIFGGSYVVHDFYRSAHPEFSFASLTTIGGISGLIVAWLGNASSTAATMRERYNTWKNLGASVILAIAAPVFIVISVSLLSAGVDGVVTGRSLLFPFSATYNTGNSASVDAVNQFFNQFYGSVLKELALILLGAAFIGGLASLAINTNRFSLHGMYRNRLIRAFLGASRASSSPNALAGFDDDIRQPNPLTGFDEKDNVNLSELWPNQYAPQTIPPSFLVVNCSLNVLASSELSWQERKALSFTATSRSVGAGALNRQRGHFRQACEYGNALSLGTAITISGAAVSPNMGYHSSSALSLLMTFFNVRLGAWLGNPGPNGVNIYKKQGPLFSAKPLIQEAFGLTTEEKRYVYLSDGGHFENLGLYEMVRRRCGLIVLSDAGCDPDAAFEDLGNAVRKISIDMNVKIVFDKLDIGPRKIPPAVGATFAVAKIVYPEPYAPVGRLLYIKPGYQGIEPASVRSYAATNPAFPHEPTSDQLFGESQFEAYRALGEYIVDALDGGSNKSYARIEDFIDAAGRRLTKLGGKLSSVRPPATSE